MPSCWIQVALYLQIHLRLTSGVVLCFLFCLSSLCVLCTKCCHFLWIVHSRLPLRFSLTFIVIPRPLKVTVEKVTTQNIIVTYQHQIRLYYLDHGYYINLSNNIHHVKYRHVCWRFRIEFCKSVNYNTNTEKLL